MLEANQKMKQEVTLFQAAVVILVTIIIISGVGYFVGQKFFWNKYDNSSVYERQIVELENFIKKTPKNKNAKVVLFDRYFGVGRYKEARVLLDSLKKDLKDNPDIMYRDALMLRQEGKMKAALETVQKVVEEKMFFTSARVLYAQLLSEDKQYEKAIEEINLVLKIMPAASDLYVEKAKICLAKGDKAEAIKAVEFALKMVPDYKDALELKKQIK